ncbi:lipoprotein [Staphylococcus aureus]|nr:lipoprotein [Staphylococcus aureus]
MNNESKKDTNTETNTETKSVPEEMEASKYVGQGFQPPAEKDVIEFVKKHRKEFEKVGEQFFKDNFGLKVKATNVVGKDDGVEVYVHCEDHGIVFNASLPLYKDAIHQKGSMRKMKILKDHIDDGIKKIADYVQGIYDEYASKIVDVIKYLINTIPKIRKNLRHAIEMLNVKKKEFLSLIPNVTCNYIKTKLEELDNTLGKWEPFLNDLKAVSPILDNHLDDIVKNMKPLIVQMIFEPSHYDDMFILNTQAHARLDQMAQQFEVVCNGLNENEGQAIQTMDQSASLIRSNLIQVKEQLEKLAVY